MMSMDAERDYGVPSLRRDTYVVGRVFTDNDGRFGNPVAIVADEEREFDDGARIRIAQAIGFSEIVFVNDRAAATISIYTVSGELTFAGHAAIGVASYLSLSAGTPIKRLQGREGPIAVAVEDASQIIWVECALSSTPPWVHEFVDSASAIDGLDGPLDPSQGHTQIWSWLDEQRSLIRSRTFAKDWDISEDEANGSGCMRLAAALGRPVEVVHGCGSQIFARPTRPGFAAVGGRVTWDKEFSLRSLSVR